MKRFFALLLLLLLPATMRGQATNRAGLVMQFGDGSVQTQCVAFGEDSISALELLQRGRLDVIAQTSGNNAAVCKIEADGCNFPAEGCFCKFGAGQRGDYWAFWQLNGTAWSYSQLGAGVARVHNGDVNGWAWGVGEEGRGAQPPVYRFDQICTDPAATAQVTDVPLINTATTLPQISTAAAAVSSPTISTPPNERQQTSNIASYAVFGALLLVSCGLIGVVLRRGGR